MRILSAVIALCLALVVGCATKSSRTNAASGQTIASLNAAANDPAADAEKRCNSVFTIFRDFIKPGSTQQEIHEVLTDTAWLERTNIVGFYFLAGWIPVDCDFQHDTAFVVSILPTLKPSTGRPPNLGYCIYFTLSGDGRRSEESAFTILTRQGASEAKVRMMEFALCYPDGTIEHVSKHKTVKFNPFSTWSK